MSHLDSQLARRRLIYLTIAGAAVFAACSSSPTPNAASDGDASTSRPTDADGAVSSSTSSSGSASDGSAPAKCAAHDIEAPAGTSISYARVDPASKRVAFSVIRSLRSGAQNIYEIWDEDICGGDQKKLAEDVASKSFAFDALGRVVYFSRLGGAKLVYRESSGAEKAFLGGCSFPLNQRLFVDVSVDGKRALVSRGDNHETIHYLGTTPDACGTVFEDGGPFDEALTFFNVPTRLSYSGKSSLRAPIPSNDCTIGTSPRDRSNDFRVYDFVTKKLVHGMTHECATMRAAAFLPDGGFVSRFNGELQVHDSAGNAVGQPVSDGLEDNGVGIWWLDVSRDGAWLVENGHVMPSPF